MSKWIIGVLVAFFPSMFFGKIGFASAFLFFGKNFPAIFLMVAGGAFTGSIIFSTLSEKLFGWWNRRFPYRLKSAKIKKIRRIIRIKEKFGLWGIALLSPVLLSYPGGCFISVKFFKQKWKIIFAMTLSASFWTTFFYVFLDKLF
ncbi:MAG: hypothetical protein N3F09_10055 [Bacteroidia bacterium]|nr:hypothetical protein [Bacteroidia bacterium]